MSAQRFDLEPPPFAFDTARAHYAADRDVVATHLKLELNLDFEQRSLRGTSTTTVRAVAPTEQVALDAAELEIEACLVDGKPVEWHHDGARLTIQLRRSLKRGAEATVAVRYRGTPRRGLYFVGPDRHYPRRPRQAWTQGQDEDSRYWFPCLDAPAQKATSEVIATFPRRMTALSNGRRVAERVHGQLRTVHHRLDSPHSPYLVTLVVGEFQEHVVRAGAVRVRTLFPKGRRADALRCTARTAQMLTLFEELSGWAYPWGDYAQVFVADFIFGGMENTSATTLTDAVLHDARAHLDYSAENLVAHELAHQWFGDLLTCRDWPHGWLNEGFATYCETLWKEHADGADEADHQRMLDFEEYLEEASERYARPIVERKFDEPIELFDRHLYEKGSLVLHALRCWLGDDAFKKSVRRYVQKHAGGSVETVDLARAVEEATGKNADPFFDQWVHRAGHPSLKVSVQYQAQARALKVHVRQTQAGDPYTLQVPLQVVTGEGSIEQVLHVDRAEQTFFVACPQAPRLAMFDPRRDLLATVEVDKPVAYWREELRRAPCARARTTAAQALGKDGSLASLQALGAAVLDEKTFWAARAAAAKALGALRVEASRGLLLKALTVRHPKVRRAVVAALSAFRDDAVVGKALLRLCRSGDRSVFVEAEAARSLGKVGGSGARAVLVSMLGRRSFLDTVASGALEGLGELRDGRAFPTVLAATKYGAPAVARRAAVAALARVADWADKRLEVVDALTQLLADRSFRVRIAAIEAARTLGDERLIGPLMRTPFLDGRERRSAREAVRALRAGSTTTKELAALRSEVESLQAQVRTLQEAVEKTGSGAHSRGAARRSRPRDR